MESARDTTLRERLKKTIVEGAFVRGEDASYIRVDGEQKNSGWLFDIRAISRKPL